MKPIFKILIILFIVFISCNEEKNTIQNSIWQGLDNGGEYFEFRIELFSDSILTQMRLDVYGWQQVRMVSKTDYAKNHSLWYGDVQIYFTKINSNTAYLRTFKADSIFFDTVYIEKLDEFKSITELKDISSESTLFMNRAMMYLSKKYPDSSFARTITY